MAIRFDEKTPYDDISVNNDTKKTRITNEKTM